MSQICATNTFLTLPFVTFCLVLLISTTFFKDLIHVCTRSHCLLGVALCPPPPPKSLRIKWLFSFKIQSSVTEKREWVTLAESRHSVPLAANHKTISLKKPFIGLCKGFSKFTCNFTLSALWIWIPGALDIAVSNRSRREAPNLILYPHYILILYPQLS